MANFAGNILRKFGEYGADIVEGNLTKVGNAARYARILESNNGINEIKGLTSVSTTRRVGEALASPFEAVSRWAHGEKGYGFTDALADTFLMEKDVAAENVKDKAGKIIREAGTREWGPSNWAKEKVAGSIVGIGMTAGIAGGLTHDTAGNIDIAGIPGI